MQTNLLPPYEIIIKHYDKQDVNIREYYGTATQDKLRTYAFRKRVNEVMGLLKSCTGKTNRVLDVGAGALFMAFPVTKHFSSDYVGIDLLSLAELKKHRNAINEAIGSKVAVIKASAYNLPFKEKSFDTAISMDTFEHLDTPNIAFDEVNRVTSEKIVISVPLENSLQKIIRLPVLLSEGTLKDPTPSFHYIGNAKNYNQMYNKILKKTCSKRVYAPFGFLKHLNFYGIHLFIKKEGEVSEL